MDQRVYKRGQKSELSQRTLRLMEGTNFRERNPDGGMIGS
jgi:hypothetical protein